MRAYFGRPSVRIVYGRCPKFGLGAAPGRTPHVDPGCPTSLREGAARDRAFPAPGLDPSMERTPAREVSHHEEVKPLPFTPCA